MNIQRRKRGREKSILIEIQRRRILTLTPPTSLSHKKQENHDEHNILLATVKYTKATSTLKEMNKMLLPTHLGYHDPEAGPEPTDVAILRSRLRATRHNGHE